MKKGEYLNINNKIFFLINSLYLIYEEIIIENLFIRFEEFGMGMVFVGKNNWKGGLMIVKLVWMFELDILVGRIFW